MAGATGAHANAAYNTQDPLARTTGDVSHNDYTNDINDPDKAKDLAEHIERRDSNETERDGSSDDSSRGMIAPELVRQMTPEERRTQEAKLVRKIDLRLLPMVVLMYIMNYLDRNNIAAARLAGLETELHLSSSQYQTAVSILFVGYLLMQVPSNLFLNKIGLPGIYLPSVMIVWGIISGSTAGVQSFGGLIAVRLFLGFVEAAYFPGCLFYLSSWYTRKELGLRTAVLYSGSLLSGAFSGLIAAGITSGLDRHLGLRAWRWLFIIEGAITVVIAVAAFFVLPNFPRTTRWLNDTERQLAVWRLQEDIGQDDWVSSAKQSFWQGFALAFSDIKTWILMVLLTGIVSAGSVTNFFPTVVATLGYGDITSLLLTAPPYVLAVITAFANAWHADRTGERLFHVILPLCVGVAAFILAAATTSTAPRYLAMMLMVPGVYTGYVVVLAWISNSIPPCDLRQPSSLIRHCAASPAMRSPRRPTPPPPAVSPLPLLLLSAVLLGLFVTCAGDDAEHGNATVTAASAEAKDSFADMIDRALEKEFPESEQNGGETDAGGFNNSVSENQAVLETVARVTPKKNDTKEEKSFQFHDVFNLDNENRGDDMPTLIDRKDNVFIISNPKSKYPVLQLDLRLISDLVVVIVSAACGGIAFACAGQPVITGYLLAGSIIGPGGFSFVSEMVQVETVAQFGVIFLLFALGLEFSMTKLRVVRAVAVLGGLLQIFLFMSLCCIIASLCGGKPSEGIFVGAFLSMSSTAVVLKFLMERNSINTLHGQVTVGTLILQDCAVGLLFGLLPVLGGTSGVIQGIMSMTKLLIVLCTFLGILSMLSRTCVPWFLKLMISLSSQTNELYQLASVAFCLLVAWCSDKLGLSLELGSFAAGVMISTTDLSQHTLEQIEPIRNFFAALFLASIGMLIHVHFLWNHVDILLAAVILVIITKTLVVTVVVKFFGYTNKTSLLVGMSLAQIGEFAFVLLSRASNLHLVGGKLYRLLLGTTALSLVTTPLLFKLIPAVIHLGVLLRWFSPDSSQSEIGFKGDSLRVDSGKRITLVVVQGAHDS